MLKTPSAVGPAASAEVEDKNLEQDGKGIQVENRDEKEPAQKSCKGQKMVKSKKWIWAKNVEISRAKNRVIQSGPFFTSRARKGFTKLRQAFVEALILNHFDLKCHI